MPKMWPKTAAECFVLFDRFIYLFIFCIFLTAAYRPGFTYENLLPGDTSSHVIDGLEEDKEYTVSIYAVFSQGPSEPVSIVGRTCKSVGWDWILKKSTSLLDVAKKKCPQDGSGAILLCFLSFVYTLKVRNMNKISIKDVKMNIT